MPYCTSAPSQHSSLFLASCARAFCCLSYPLDVSLTQLRPRTWRRAGKTLPWTRHGTANGNSKPYETPRQTTTDRPLYPRNVNVRDNQQRQRCYNLSAGEQHWKPFFFSPRNLALFIIGILRRVFSSPLTVGTLCVGRRCRQQQQQQQTSSPPQLSSTSTPTSAHLRR